MVRDVVKFRNSAKNTKQQCSLSFRNLSQNFICLVNTRTSVLIRIVTSVRLNYVIPSHCFVLCATNTAPSIIELFI